MPPILAMPISGERCGIGSQTLRAIAAWLGKREGYCVPYIHLVEFYGRSGLSKWQFARSFLAERLGEYQRHALI